LTPCCCTFRRIADRVGEGEAVFRPANDAPSIGARCWVVRPFS
jgi:hypothetical protein